MSLEIDSGFLAHLLTWDREGADWLREEIATVNEVLGRNQLPTFSEPEKLPPHRMHQIGYSWSDLHLLRRAWLLTKEGKQLTPTDDLDEVVELETDLCSIYPESHLVCHSDRDGYYAPVDFPEVLYDEDVPGGMLGSSYGLQRELLEVAPALGIELARGAPTPAAVERILASQQPFGRELAIWLGLFEATRLSITHGSLIVFH